MEICGQVSSLAKQRKQPQNEPVTLEMALSI
jgi:hypothetical protein